MKKFKTIRFLFEEASAGIRATRKTNRNLLKKKGLPNRRLEIGPGEERIRDFETLNIIDGPNVDYVADAAKPLPFQDETFSVIYASHVLEHIPWYQTKTVLKDWIRVLKRGGVLEIWVPDGLKICDTFVKAESQDPTLIEADGWFRFNEEREVCKWAAGRIYTYGDGTGEPCHPNWHRAIFSPRYLQSILNDCGLQDVRLMSNSEVRGYDHGWINLGACGTKP